MADDDLSGWALPAFKPDEAVQGLKRQLRELGLAERAGLFERRGSAIARVAVEGAVIAAARVKKPMRSGPEWLKKSLKSGADVRDFVAELKKALAQWSDHDD